jgi:acylphosphatase
MYADAGEAMPDGFATEFFDLRRRGFGLEQRVIDHCCERALRYAWHKVLSKKSPPAYLFRVEELTKHYLISGRVQGVGFRAFVEKNALRLQLSGWVRNLADGRVEVVARGESSLLNEFEVQLKNGPARGHVESLLIREWTASDFDAKFAVRKDGFKPCCED